jgi:CheY-like chemotaxis protein
MNTGPILIVDDDTDDREFLQTAWEKLKYANPLVFLSHGEEVLHYLKSTKQKPFLILCEVNIPKMDGFQLKANIQQDSIIKYKAIPFIFWSSEVSAAQIQKAYDLGTNGFFVKEGRIADIAQSLSDIVTYWLKSKVPQ